MPTGWAGPGQVVVRWCGVVPPHVLLQGGRLRGLLATVVTGQPGELGEVGER